jgi:acetyl-CoA carboxylase biotin carboxyl carrier protein
MARERVERNSTNGNGAPSAEQEAPNLEMDVIRQLISLMNGSDLEEIAIEHQDGLKLVLRKPAPEAASATLATALEFDLDGLDGRVVDEPAVANRAAETTVEVSAPLVGVYRARVKPGAKPLVQPGDVVREGQIVAAVEALNFINEVESTAAGRVQEIFVRDGQPVEYGQPLLSIEPK